LLSASPDHTLMPGGLCGAFATKWCSDWRIACTFAESNRAAIGSMLLCVHPVAAVPCGNVYVGHEALLLWPGAERRDPQNTLTGL
jgi:hypothetical protein